MGNGVDGRLVCREAYPDEGVFRACGDAGQGPHEATRAARKTDDAAPTSTRELDYLYKEADKLYYCFARRCGLSTCAYWMMYDIEREGGSAELTALTDSWAYSKQTVNSALKSLQAKGLIELEFVEGSRRRKRALLTDDGRAFSARYIVPAIQAEERAFMTIGAKARAAYIETARAFTRALAREFDVLTANLDRADTDSRTMPGRAGCAERGAGGCAHGFAAPVLRDTSGDSRGRTKGEGVK